MSEFNDFLSDSGLTSVLEAAGVPLCPRCGKEMRKKNPAYGLQFVEYYCHHKDGNRWILSGKDKTMVWHINPSAVENFSHRADHCGEYVKCQS